MSAEMGKRCEPWQRDLGGLPYVSIVPDRTPALKYHVGLARAKAAVAWERPSRYNRDTRRFEYRGVRGGEIYERDGHSWKLLHRVEAGTIPEDLPWRNGGGGLCDETEMDCE